MRIDKFLKNSRLIKRRTIAKEACIQERIKINDKIAKPSDVVKVGDILEITFGNSAMTIEVLSIIDGAKKKDVEEMYRLV